MRERDDLLFVACVSCDVLPVILLFFESPPVPRSRILTLSLYLLFSLLHIIIIILTTQGSAGEIDSICTDIGMCSAADFRLTRSSLHRASASADAVARAKQSLKITPKQEDEIPAFSPGRGGLDSKTLKKEADDTILSVAALRDSHTDGGVGTKKPAGKTSLLEIGKEEIVREGTAQDMERLLAHLLSSTGDDEEKDKVNQENVGTVFLETSSMTQQNLEPTNIEDYLANMILKSNSKKFHNAGG